MPSNSTVSRQEQLYSTFRALGCDEVHVYFDHSIGQVDPMRPVRGQGRWRCTAGWHDDSGRPPVRVNIVGDEPINLLVLAGMLMSEKLAAERPELTFPDVVWT